LREKFCWRIPLRGGAIGLESWFTEEYGQT